MERRKHWWNGSWGRMARRDVLLYEDAGRWLIEVRQGGAEGRSAFRECDDEDAALDHVRALISLDDGWRELV